MVTCAGCEKGGKGGRGVTAAAAARGRDTAEGGGGCWEGGCCGWWGDLCSGAQGCGSGDGIRAGPAAGRAPVRGARAAVALRQTQSLQVSHLQYSNMLLISTSLHDYPAPKEKLHGVPGGEGVHAGHARVFRVFVHLRVLSDVPVLMVSEDVLRLSGWCRTRARRS